MIVEDSNLTLTINNDFFGLSYLKTNIEDDKEYVRFIKKVERQVRSSEEYKEFISYLKKELDINYCFVMNKITSEDAKIEMHHMPLTLYDIVDIVIKRLIANNKPFNTFIVSYIVMQLHYGNKIGLVPLSVTMHQYIHSDNGSNVVIPREAIIGNIEDFYNEYKNYMNEEQVLKYQRCINTKYDKDNDTIADNDFQSIEARKQYLEQVKTITVKTINLEHNNNDNSDNKD